MKKAREHSSRAVVLAHQEISDDRTHDATEQYAADETGLIATLKSWATEKIEVVH